MRRLVLIAAVALTALLPSASSAQTPAHIALMGINQSPYGTAVTLRCAVPDQSHCRARVAVRLADNAVSGMRRGVLLADRALLVPAGEPRVVWLQAEDAAKARALRQGRLQVGVLARHGSRRITTLVRARLDRIRVPSLGANLVAGGATGDRVVAGSVISAGCGLVISVRQLVQSESGVELALDAQDRPLPENVVCAAVIRAACVRVALDAPLGERAVWQRVGGVWQAFPAPRAGQQGYPGDCPEIPPGGTATV